MKPTFVFSLDAEFDLSGIVNFIAERNLDAAIDLLDQINDTCQTLAENPDLGELRGLRCTWLPIFYSRVARHLFQSQQKRN